MPAKWSPGFADRGTEIEKRTVACPSGGMVTVRDFGDTQMPVALRGCPKLL